MNAQAISMYLRALIIGICVFIVCSGHPPAKGQALSSEDAVQDNDIRAINRHLESTDSKVENQAKDIQVTSSIVSEMQGEQRVFFSVLGALTTGSIAFQVRSKKV